MGAAIWVAVVLLFGLAVWLWDLVRPRSARYRIRTYEHSVVLDGVRVVYMPVFILIIAALTYGLVEGSPQTRLLSIVLLLLVCCVYLLATCDRDTFTSGLFHPWMFLRYKGETNFPTRVYEGNSHNIRISLDRHPNLDEPNHRSVEAIEGRDGGHIAASVLYDPAVDRFLEIELQSAGFNVEGEKKQQQELGLPKLSYSWSCNFEKSGEHELGLVFRLVGPSDTETLGSVSYKVRVVKLLNLTSREIYVYGIGVSAVAGVITVGLGAAKNLHDIGIWWRPHHKVVRKPAPVAPPAVGPVVPPVGPAVPSAAHPAAAQVQPHP